MKENRNWLAETRGIVIDIPSLLDEGETLEAAIASGYERIENGITDWLAYRKVLSEVGSQLKADLTKDMDDWFRKIEAEHSISRMRDRSGYASPKNSPASNLKA